VQSARKKSLKKVVLINVSFKKEKEALGDQINATQKTNVDDAVVALRNFAEAVDDVLWTHIDDFDGMFNNKMVTYYDVNVTYQSARVRAGMAFEESGILHFDINLPAQIQGQGVSSEIFQRAIADYSPSKVEGLWKSSGNYLGGESVNLTIFKQKVADGFTDIQAVFETPTGKILKANGFDGIPTILINTNDEVKVLFNPTN
jgi:hypothetical protein